MSKKIMILGGLLFLGSVGMSQATPLDSPDVVYVDGLPCNRFCQSYLGWSLNRSSVRREQPASAQPAQLPPKPAAHRATTTRAERSKPAAQVRVTKQAAPASIKTPPAKPADAQPAAKTAADSDSPQAKIVETPPANEAAPRSDATAPGPDATQEKIANSSPAGDAAGSNTRAIAAPESIAMSQAKPADVEPAAKTAVDSDRAQAKIMESNPASEAAPGSDATAPSSDATPEKTADSSSASDATAGSNTSAIQEQVTSAAAAAPQMTVATVVPEAEPKADDTDRSDRAETAMLGDAEKTGSTPPNDTDLLVAVLMARPEIESVSDLANKDIAIDDREAASNGSVRTAIAAAGATEVKLSEAQTRAVDRLISGDVPAAVLALVSPEAAEGYPEIPGFRIFRIPLSPRALKARL
jgi:hypothetical protein